MSTLLEKANAIKTDKDTNLLSANLKSGVTCLGVTGSLTPAKPEQTKAATPSTSSQTIEPDSGYALSSVTVGAVTSSIDSNITQNNIKAGVTILGVQGNLQPDKPDQSKIVSPTTGSQTITPDTGYELASVTINPVTNSIDANITAENIKKDVTILVYKISY